jgi:hypothetical protein
MTIRFVKKNDDMIMACIKAGAPMSVKVYWLVLQ